MDSFAQALVVANLFLAFCIGLRLWFTLGFINMLLVELVKVSRTMNKHKWWG